MSSSQLSESRTVPVIQSVAENSIRTEHEPGVHFLTDDQNTLVISRMEESDPGEISDGGASGTVRSKSELLEYLIRDDGSVACKLCGEVLASRTHWYRHKYKLHVSSSIGTSSASTASVGETIAPSVPLPQPPVPAATTTPGMSPSPLFRCVHCNVFFKSRKGYMGHVSARHSSEVEEEATVWVTEVGATETVITSEGPPAKVPRKKEVCSRGADWEQQREKEEKLVADIIDRVRRECEAQGAAVSRRGYSRRSTVMNTCN